jgi:hypothetical protein
MEGVLTAFENLRSGLTPQELAHLSQFADSPVNETAGINKLTPSPTRIQLARGGKYRQQSFSAYLELFNKNSQRIIFELAKEDFKDMESLRSENDEWLESMGDEDRHKELMKRIKQGNISAYLEVKKTLSEEDYKDLILGIRNDWVILTDMACDPRCPNYIIAQILFWGISPASLSPFRRYDWQAIHWGVDILSTQSPQKAEAVLKELFENPVDKGAEIARLLDIELQEIGIKIKFEEEKIEG